MENKKNTLVIILVIVIAILCLTIGWLLGSKFADTENEVLDDSNTNIEENNPTTEEQNVNIETEFNNFIITKGLNVNENVYDKAGLSSISCTYAKLASGKGYSLEIYKFDSEESAKRYYYEQNSSKLKVSNVKQLIKTENINNYDIMKQYLHLI